MKKSMKIILSIMLLALTVTGCSNGGIDSSGSGGGTYVLSGQVVGMDGVPVEDVELAFSGSGTSTIVMTDEEGRWTASGFSGEVTVMVTKKEVNGVNYTSFPLRHTVSKEKRDLNFKIMPGPEKIFAVEAIVDNPSPEIDPLVAIPSSKISSHVLINDEYSYNDVDISPDGTKLALVDGGVNIYIIDLIDPDMTDSIFPAEVLFSENEGNILTISWSPDGEKLVYACKNRENKDDEVFTINSNGRGRKKLGSGIKPVWTNKGIFYWQEEGSNFKLKLMDANGEDMGTYDEVIDEMPFKPAVSRDKNHLAYVVREGNDEVTGIYRLDLLQNNLKAKKIIDETPDFDSLTWSPDKSRLAYSVEDGTKTRIKIVSIDRTLNRSDNNRPSDYLYILWTE